MTRIAGNLYADQCTLLIISLRTRNVSDKSCRENQNTTFVLNNFLENHAVYVIRGAILWSRRGHR
jgi:hypothetical protein